MKYQAMNAKPCKDLQKLIDSKEYIAEIKLDGYRAICEYGRFYSRLGNELTDKVPHLQLPVNMVLDGELLFGNNSSGVTTVLGSKVERALQLQEKEKVRFVIFDILELEGESLIEKPWTERILKLQSLSMRLFDLNYVSFSKIWDNIPHAVDIAEKTAAEGLMLKNINAEYYPGKRPENTWYKLKKHDTADVKIVGFTEGKGKVGYKEIECHKTEEYVKEICEANGYEFLEDGTMI